MPKWSMPPVSLSKGVHCAIAVAITLGALAYLGLHIFEPALSHTWAYAHLDRHPGARLLSWAAVALFPLLAVWSSRLPWAERAVRPPLTSRTTILAVICVSVLFLTAGWFWPVKAISIDSPAFAIFVWKGQLEMARWQLTIFTMTSILRFAEWASPFPVPARDLVPWVNAFLSGASYVLMFECARQLGSKRFEVLILAALAGTAFGNLQLSLYYVDIYPVVQFAMVLFLWTSFRVLAQKMHPIWPVLIAMVGPFFYVGLVLLLPALFALMIVCLRRQGGARQLAYSVGVGVLAAGCATLPGFGRPFAFGEYRAAIAAHSAAAIGLSKGSSLLPFDYLFSRAHLAEYFHTFLLVDGVGILLCLTAGLPMLVGVLRGDLAKPQTLLILIAGTILSYAFVMDPLWGAYSDWDLFSYAAVPTSLLGGYAFVVWGRSTPRLRAALFGLLLAGNLIHLAARLNAIELERDRHMLESPSHIELLRPPGSTPPGQRP